MNSFFGLGPMELVLIIIIALVVLGPERLPGAIREVMKYWRYFRNLSGELTAQFSEELQGLDDLNPQKILEDLASELDEEVEQTKEAAGVKKSAKKETATKKATPKKPAAPAKSAASTSQKTDENSGDNSGDKSDDAPIPPIAAAVAAASAKTDGKDADEPADASDQRQETNTENTILPPAESDEELHSEPSIREATGDDGENLQSPVAEETSAGDVTASAGDGVGEKLTDDAIAPAESTTPIAVNGKGARPEED